MAMAAQRFKFLDKETNVGTVDFIKLSDNSVYTAAVDTADSAIAALKEGESLLTKLNDSIEDLLETVSNATTAIMKKIKEGLNAAIDKLLSAKLPSFVSKVLDSLKALDLPGVKSFFKDLLRVGSVFLCNNLDFLKSFMLGYSLTENILSGLIIGLLLSWLDRYCKGFSKEEVAAATNKGKLGMLFKYDGITLSPGTVLGKFSNMFADLSRYNATKEQLVSRLSQNSFIEKALFGSKNDITQNFYYAKVSSVEKQKYISLLDSELSKHDPASQEYENIQIVKTELENFTVTGKPDKNDFIKVVTTGDAETLLTNLRTLEISSSEKKLYLSYIEELLTSHQPGTETYNLLLKVRGDLIKLPLISQERIEKENNYSGLKDAIGSMAINIGSIDLSQINKHVLTEQEKSLLDKLYIFKEETLKSVDIQTRTHESGSFADFDFNKILPVLNEDEKLYIEKLPGLEESHRYINLHPTTEVFTESSVPNVAPTKPNTTPASQSATSVQVAVTTESNPELSKDLYQTTVKIPRNCHA